MGETVFFGFLLGYDHAVTGYGQIKKSVKDESK